MKKIFAYFLMSAILLMMLTVSIGATEVNTEAGTFTESVTETEAVTETETETETETKTETETTLETVTEDGEIGLETVGIDQEASFSEVVLALADKFDISVEKAEELARDIKVIGDKYLGDSDLWALVVEDMSAHPAKWTLYCMVVLLIIALIGVLIKRVLNDAITVQRIKIAIEELAKALNGDEKDENGKAVSIRGLIGEKNGQIEALEAQNKAQKEQIISLENKAEKLTGVITALDSAIEKIQCNSDTSLKLTEETTLQILQLINIAMDRKVPVTSKEARQIWYEATQNKIKSIYEEGTNGDSEKKTESV
jgi:hypothetical protein